MEQLRPIVVAEENPDDLYLMTRRIKATGVKNPLVNFFDPADTIAFLERSLRSKDEFAIPYVLFTDLNLLGGDGFEIIRWARQQPRLSSLHIFVLTGSEHPAHRRQAEELQVSGYLLKFPSVDEFKRLLTPVG